MPRWPICKTTVPDRRQRACQRCWVWSCHLTWSTAWSIPWWWVWKSQWSLLFEDLASTESWQCLPLPYSTCPWYRWRIHCPASLPMNHPPRVWCRRKSWSTFGPPRKSWEKCRSDCHRFRERHRVELVGAQLCKAVITRLINEQQLWNLLHVNVADVLSPLPDVFHRIAERVRDIGLAGYLSHAVHFWI